MTIDESRRHELHDAVRRTLGTGLGDTLMELLPPVGWADVATRHDVDSLAVASKRDLEALAATTTRDINALAATTTRDINALAATTTRDINALAATTTREIEHLGETLRTEMQTLETRVENLVLASEHRILFWMVTTLLGGLATAVAVARSV